MSRCRKRRSVVGGEKCSDGPISEVASLIRSFQPFPRQVLQRSNSDRQLRQQHPERQPSKSGRRERAAAQKTAMMKAKLAGSIATNMTDIMSASAGRSSRLFKAATTSQSKISISTHC